MKMILLQALLCSIFFSCGSSVPDVQGIAFDTYYIKTGKKTDADAVSYLYNHFSKRTKNGIVLLESTDKVPADSSTVQFINIVLDPKMDTDYAIEKKKNNLTLKANSKKTLYWLFYQYLQALSENDSKVDGSDLPPAIVSFKTEMKGSFAFAYREPYLQANLLDDYDVIVNTNSVDKDWGIWGHQLFNLINKEPKNAYYSTIDGSLNKNQLCLGNPETYSFLENYIIDNFGDQENNNQNFVISPADNNLVCTCNICTKLGNVTGNSSASVLNLIHKLAQRFPNHQFFTIDYLSVKTPPVIKMLQNTGIIISSIALPRQVNFDSTNESVQEFEIKVKKWKAVAPKIYVWDYISNFDDYLTPFATLAVCKSNFNFYKKLQVNGIFANGAGYDYSTFNTVHTYVLAALMQDPTLDINHLIKRYCTFYYRESGEMIANYIIGLENEVRTNKIKLDLYNGIKKMAGTYLSTTDFFEFYTTVAKQKDSENEDVTVRMNQLYTGLTFTALQIQLSNKLNPKFGFGSLINNQITVNENFTTRYNYFLEQFKTYEVFITKEKNGNVVHYLNDIEKLIINSNLKPNLLSSALLKIESSLDEDYTDTSVLTDGVPGLPSDYHNGWLIVSGTDLIAQLDFKNKVGNYKFKFSFLLDEHLKMRAPEKIEIILNNKIIQTIRPDKTFAADAERIILATAVKIAKNDQVKIKIYRDKTFKKFGCDEIYLYK